MQKLIYSYMYICIYISSCPAGYLRQHACCVLCSGVAKVQRKQTHKATTATKNERQNGHPKIIHFRYFSWRPPGTIFKGFGGGSRCVFSCFFEHVGQGSVLRKTSFRIIIYNVFGTSTFSKQVKN